jgi:hypothetical protein
MNELISLGRLKRTSFRLKNWGSVTKVTVGSPHERGAMEVTSVKLEFTNHNPIDVSMFRRPDGKIAQFLF